MAKSNLSAIRKAPRIAPLANPKFFLPPRAALPVTVHPKPGFHTYYLSCDPRSLAPYIQHAANHFHRGFRAAFVGPAGLVFEPPGVVVLGLQDGDAFSHATAWATRTPLDEYHLEHMSRSRELTVKDQQKAQARVAEAIAMVEALEEQMVEAAKELSAATQNVLVIQGVEAINIEGVYYDPSYSRENVYLKRRETKFTPLEEPLELKRSAKKPAKKARR